MFAFVHPCLITMLGLLTGGRGGMAMHHRQLGDRLTLRRGVSEAAHTHVAWAQGHPGRSKAGQETA